MILSALHSRSAATAAIGRPLTVFLVATAVAAPALAVVQAGLEWTTAGWQLTQFATVVGAIAAVSVGPRPLPVPSVVRRRLVLACSVALGLGTAVAGGAGVLADLFGTTAGGGEEAVPWSFALVVGTVAGAFGEEIGWRGVVQPMLETRFRWWTAAVLVGVLFGGGHFHVLSAGPVGYAVFVGSAVGLSVLAAWLGRGRSRGQRVLLGTVLHAVVNLGLLPVGPDHDLSSLPGVSAMAAATLLPAAVVLAIAARRGSVAGPGAYRPQARHGGQRRDRSSTTT